MFDDIYAIFQLETDGEEFDSDEDALIAANIAMREILMPRDWKFLEKSYTMPTGSLSLAGITGLDKVLRIWYNEIELEKGGRKDRYNDEKDYWVDTINNVIVPVGEGNTLTEQEMIMDYKYKPVDITATNTPITKEGLIPLIAWKMVMNYYRKDQDSSFYQICQDKYNEGMDILVNEDANFEL